MKVALCAPLDLSSAGGVETHILQLAREIDKSGTSIDVFGNDSSNTYQSLDAFQPEHYDIIHTHGDALNPSLARKLLHPPPTQRHIHTLHGISLFYLRACQDWLNWRCYTATMTEAFLARRADHLICVSQSIANGAQNFFATDPSRTSVIFNGVTSDWTPPKDTFALRKKFGLKPQDCAIVFVGRGEDRVKGTEAITRSMDLLSQTHKNIKLLAIPGTGFKPAPWLCSTGKIDYQDIGQVYAIADIFLNASLNEGLPLTLIEAMAAGLPIIAAPVGGIPEIITHNKTGLLLQPDRADLTEKLTQLISDTALQKRLGQAAATAAQDLTWKKMATQTINIYESTL